MEQVYCFRFDFGGPVAIIVIITTVHYNSESYWGKQYYKVYSSPYLTHDERQAIQKNSHTIAILPDEFDTNPKQVKEQLKQAKAVLKKRKKAEKALKNTPQK